MQTHPLCILRLCEAGITVVPILQISRLRLSDLTKHMHVVNGKAGIWIQAGWLQSHHFEPFRYTCINCLVD